MLACMYRGQSAPRKYWSSCCSRRISSARAYVACSHPAAIKPASYPHKPLAPHSDHRDGVARERSFDLDGHDTPGRTRTIHVHYDTYIHTVTWEEMLSAMAHGFLPDIAGMLCIGIYASWCVDSGMRRCVGGGGICTVRTQLAAQSTYALAQVPTVGTCTYSVACRKP